MAGSSGKMAQVARGVAGAALIVGLWWAGGRLALLSPAPVPGAVIGLGLLLLLLRAPGVRGLVARPAALLTGVLGALIAPAAVALGDGIPGLAPGDGARIAAVLVISTLMTGIATALLWRAFAR